MNEFSRMETKVKHIHKSKFNRWCTIISLTAAGIAWWHGYTNLMIWCLFSATWNDITDHLEHIQLRLNDPNYGKDV